MLWALKKTVTINRLNHSNAYICMQYRSVSHLKVFAFIILSHALC